MKFNETPHTSSCERLLFLFVLHSPCCRLRLSHCTDRNASCSQPRGMACPLPWRTMKTKEAPKKTHDDITAHRDIVNGSCAISPPGERTSRGVLSRHMWTFAITERQSQTSADLLLTSESHRCWEGRDFPRAEGRSVTVRRYSGRAVLVDVKEMFDRGTNHACPSWLTDYSSLCFSSLTCRRRYY